jgi:soluble lytic murein transglycosylase-like protein
MKLKSALKVTLLLAASAAFSPADAGETLRQVPSRPEAIMSAYAQARPPARAGNNELAAIVDREAAAHGVPTAIARAVVRVESGWNPRITGRAGEVGLMQIKHGTARAMGYTGSRAALYDPATNIRFGMKYLAAAYRLSGGNVCVALAKYQGGLQARPGSAMARKYCAQARSFMASN